MNLRTSQLNKGCQHGSCGTPRVLQHGATLISQVVNVNGNMCFDVTCDRGDVVDQ